MFHVILVMNQHPGRLACQTKSAHSFPTVTTPAGKCRPWTKKNMTAAQMFYKLAGILNHFHHTMPQRRKKGEDCW